MAARDEKLIHFSFAVVATGAPLQTVLVVLGAAFWLGLNDQRGSTHNVLIVGVASVVMTTFAVTIGCASRPVIRGAFLIYALWELMVMIIAVIVIGAVVGSTEHCELSPGNGEAAVPTSDMCPQLVASASTIEDAKEMCLDSATKGLCEWSDKCSLETAADGCATVLPSGTCILTADGECRVADTSAPVRDVGVLDLWGTCVPTTGCRYNVFLQAVGWSLCTMAGVTLMAILNILNDSRFPLGLQIASRRKMRCDNNSYLFCIGLACVSDFATQLPLLRGTVCGRSRCKCLWTLAFMLRRMPAFFRNASVDPPQYRVMYSEELHRIVELYRIVETGRRQK